jgi:hypothetical protein
MNFWFEPTTPTNLGVCRLLIYAAFLIRYLVVPLDVSAFLQMSDAFWKPMPMLGFLRFPMLPRPWPHFLEIAWLVTLGLSSIGVFTRLSTLLAFFLGLYLLSIPHNFGKLHHMDMIAVLVMGIMMLSRCGDGCSADRLARTARRGPRPPTTSSPLSGEYTWPIRAVWLVMACIFFAAGVSKLRNGGLEWVFSDSLALMLIKANYLAFTGYPPLLSWGLHLGQQVWLCQLLAAVTIIAEVGYPLVLFGRSARWILVPGVLFLQIGIILLLVPAFAELVACHVFWVPWDRLGWWCAARFRSLSS